MRGEEEEALQGTSQGEGGEAREGDEGEANVNRFTSPFYIGKFFLKQPDSSAKCSTCQAIIKTKQGNTFGLDNHLSWKHRKDNELYKVKKAEIESKMGEMRTSWKRACSQDMIKSKQSKLEIVS